MSRKVFLGIVDPAGVAEDPEMRAMHEIGSDLYALMRAKEIIIALWKESRIDVDQRIKGEEALAGAILAIENPSRHYIGALEAKRAAVEQWRKSEDAKKREF